MQTYYYWCNLDDIDIFVVEYVYDIPIFEICPTGGLGPSLPV